MTATHNTNCTASNAPVLYLALELGASNWKLAFTVGLGQKPKGASRGQILCRGVVQNVSRRR